MLTLPTDVMIRILKCMDAPTKAKIAQTSSSWRAVIYRNSEWAFWVPRIEPVHRAAPTEVYCGKFGIPKGSHHCGEPTKLCFMYWASQKLKYHIMHDIPREILAIDNPKKCIDTLYKYWKHIKKPCLQVSHHKWSHVCTLSRFVPQTKESLEYLIHRTTEQHHSTTNPYRFWLMSYVNEFPPISYNVSKPENTADTMMNIYVRQFNDHNEKLRELSQRQEAFIVGWHSSIANLARVGHIEFQTNELLYKRGLPDACAFSVCHTVGSSTSSAVSTIVHSTGSAPCAASASLVFEKGFEPKKPLCAESGEG